MDGVDDVGPSVHLTYRSIAATEMDVDEKLSGSESHAMKRYALRLILRADLIGIVPLHLIECLNSIGRRSSLGDGSGFEWTCDVAKRFTFLGVITKLMELDISFVATSVMLWAKDKVKHEGKEEEPKRVVRAHVGLFDSTDARADDGPYSNRCRRPLNGEGN